MRLTILLITLIASTYSFHPVPRLVRPKTELGIERRDVVITGIAALIAAPRLAQAKGSSTWFYDEKIETVKEASQMPTDGRLDVNAAFVVRHSVFVNTIDPFGKDLMSFARIISSFSFRVTTKFSQVSFPQLQERLLPMDHIGRSRIFTASPT